jgi:DNA-binding CsgD family transcriptional regulator
MNSTMLLNQTEGKEVAEIRQSHCAGRGFGRGPANEAFLLSPRQFQTVQLVCEGLSTAEIAERLNLTVRTIKQFLGVASLKMGFASDMSKKRGRIMRKCFDTNLIDGSDRHPLPETLTQAEREIAVWALEGITSKEIADLRECSEQAVKNFLTSVFDKCGCWSKEELIRRYVGESQ